MILPSDTNTSEVLKPREKPLYLPSFPIAPQRSPILGFDPPPISFMWRNHRNAQTGHFDIQRVAVVGLVTDDPLGKLNQKTSLNRFSHQLHFMRRSAVHV